MRIIVAAFLIIAAGGALFSFVVERLGVPPRSLAPYVERRASGHNPVIVKTGNLIGQTLRTVDRGSITPHDLQSLTIGAQTAISRPPSPALKKNTILIATPAQAIAALKQAQPGDVITFLPGIYRFQGVRLDVTRPGTQTDPITVRAEQPGTVELEFNTTEGFIVSAPYWTFENLKIRGVCTNHSYCEHAFHVVGKGAYFAARNNTLLDFNAHFKVNGEHGFMPDNGLIESNTLSNTTARKTANPVTPIDLVAVNSWVIRRNLISDFIKAEGDRISYGAFAKGAGAANRFEQNILVCEHHLQNFAGQRVGLSFGGGGTGKPFCRDKRCITEQDGGIIHSNLIASCSDDGIYINRSATSKISHNTLVDTGGIVVRFPESSADIEGNLVDGTIRARDSGVIRALDNFDTSMTKLYLGLHPVRRLFAESSELNFAWSGPRPRRKANGPFPIDLCDGTRELPATYGAFENFAACLHTPQTSSK